MKKSLSILLALILAFSAFCMCVSAKADHTNVIIMIGDGMGMNHIKWTEKTYNKTMFVSGLANSGWSKTNSWSGTTDSAAGGTALATGKHTFNGNLGCIGFDMNDMGVRLCDYKNLCEVAKGLGKKAGVLTSDTNYGATPASFTVHAGDRGLKKEICEQQLNSNFDLIWAAPDADKVEDRYLTQSKLTQAGWTCVSTYTDVKALTPGTKSFGQFNNSIQYSKDDANEASLSNLTTEAIKQLDCEQGFFLMVEGAHIDKNSHSNDYVSMFGALYEFDKAIKNAVDFAKEDGNTIVIITADHETGGITFDEGTNDYKFTKTGHSSANVPVFVYGSDELVKEGSVVVNTSVAKFAAQKLGADKLLPAVTFNKDFFKEFFTALFAKKEK